MGMQRLFFWREWPADRQRRFQRTVFWSWSLVLCGVWLALFLLTIFTGKDLDEQRQMRQRVSLMTAEVRTLQARPQVFAGFEPQDAAGFVVRDLGLDARLTMARPVAIGGGQSGVQLVFEGLDLPPLLDLLSQLKARAGLRIVSFILNRRFDDATLADVHMILAR
jgi:hypothetical protein